MKIKKQLAVLRESLNNAKIHFEIWDTLKEHGTVQESVDIMNRYRIFYPYTIAAHFNSYILALYQILETRPDTVNISRLREELRSQKMVKKIVLDELSNELIKAKKIGKGICIIRNNAVGHVSKNNSQKEVFKKANITSREIKQLLIFANELILIFFV